MIENPAFYAVFEQSGQPLPLDFRQMAGITFGDTVLVATEHALPGESRESLMFHEIIHVIQYATLGIEQFIQQYVIGWASAGFDYYQIPFERDAYALQADFDRGAAASDIEAEVVRRLGFPAPQPKTR